VAELDATTSQLVGFVDPSDVIRGSDDQTYLSPAAVVAPYRGAVTVEANGEAVSWNFELPLRRDADGSLRLTARNRTWETIPDAERSALVPVRVRGRVVGSLGAVVNWLDAQTYVEPYASIASGYGGGNHSIIGLAFIVALSPVIIAVKTASKVIRSAQRARARSDIEPAFRTELEAHAAGGGGGPHLALQAAERTATELAQLARSRTAALPAALTMTAEDQLSAGELAEMTREGAATVLPAQPGSQDLETLASLRAYAAEVTEVAQTAGLRLEGTLSLLPSSQPVVDVPGAAPGLGERAVYGLSDAAAGATRSVTRNGIPVADMVTLARNGNWQAVRLLDAVARETPVAQAAITRYAERTIQRLSATVNSAASLS
jgi:antitoxin (DNA-binding transcriptional repressor) of toxin-antitoxin stability system